MSRMTLAALASIILPALACSSTVQGRDADARVTLTTDRSTYAPADTVSVTLKNDSDADVGYNLCNRALERLASQSWEEVQRFPEPPNVCTMDLRILSQGESVRVEAIIPASAAMGHYRLTFFGSPPGARTTNEFAIESH
jgi:hypothetical protein